MDDLPLSKTVWVVGNFSNHEITLKLFLLLGNLVDIIRNLCYRGYVPLSEGCMFWVKNLALGNKPEANWAAMRVSDVPLPDLIHRTR